MTSVQVSALNNFKWLGSQNLISEYSLVAVFLLLLVFEKWVKKFIRNIRLRDADYQENKSYEFDNLPGPSRYPIIGSLHHLSDLRNTVNMFLDYSKRFGPVIRFDLLSEKFVILNSAPMAQILLQSTDLGHYPKSPLIYDMAFKGILGNGLITSEGEHWRSQRRLLSPTFSYNSFQNYCKIFIKYSHMLVSDLNNLFQNKVNLKSRPIGPLIHTTEMHIICEAVMGLDICADKKDGVAFYEALKTTKLIFGKRTHNPLLFSNFFWKFHPLSKEYDQAVDTVLSVGKKMIAKHKVAKEEAEKSGKELKDLNENVSKGRNMIEEMLKSNMSDSDILYEVNTMIFAGFETTSGTAHYFLYLLALNQKHQALCREEVDAVLVDPMKCPDGELTYDAIVDLKYVERCFNETLRLFPLVFSFIRHLKKPLRLTDTLEIPAGVNLATAPLTFHRNPEYYPNPEIFDPDRFLPENIKKRPQMSYIPFSAGQRVCIGAKFAMMNVKTVVAQILRHFEVSTTDEMNDVVLVPNLFLMPERDYNFIFKRRQDIPIRKT